MARVELTYVVWGELTNQVVSHLRNIFAAINPRKRLQLLMDMVGETGVRKDLAFSSKYAIDESLFTVFDFLKSLWVCQRLDLEKATQEGVPLTLDTLVEDHFTHEASVKLHLDVMGLTTWFAGTWEEEHVEFFWKELLRSIPEVQDIMLEWLGDRKEIFTRQAKQLLEKKLKTSGEELKQLPGFSYALAVYDPEFYDDMPDSDDIYSSY